MSTESRTYRAICIVSLFLILGIASCKSDSAKTDGEVVEPDRTGKEVRLIDKKFSDVSPSMNSDGSKVVFLSGRAPHEGYYRAYKKTIGTDETASRLTDQEDVEELSAILSPDGKWVGIWGRTDEGKLSIFVQSYDTAAKRLSIEIDGIVVNDMSFGKEGSQLFAFSVTSDEGEKAIYMLKFSDDGSTLTETSRTQVGDLVTGERDHQLVNTTGFTGLVSWRLTGVQGVFYFRDLAADGSLSGVSELRSDEFAHVSDVGFDYGELGLGYTVVRGTDAAQVVPETDLEDEPSKIYRRQEVRITDKSATNIKAVGSQQFAVQGIDLLEGGSYGLLLGTELFECQAAGEGVFYGSTLLLYDSSQKITRLLVKEGIDDTSSKELVTGTYCAAFSSEKGPDDQPVDLQIDRIAGGYSSTDSKIRIAYQSWHGGDYEINHLEFVYTGTEIKDAVFTKVSDNPYQE